MVSFLIHRIENLYKEIVKAKKSIGKIFYGITEQEKGSSSKEEAFATMDIKKDKFSIQNIDLLRPNLGAHPRFFYKILGKKSNKNIKAQMPIKINKIKQKSNNS